jgi:hypothetical protein
MHVFITIPDLIPIDDFLVLSVDDTRGQNFLDDQRILIAFSWLVNICLHNIPPFDFDVG